MDEVIYSMAERKPINKKIRFEVFKRDSFRCQYCGRSAPDVILEVDHIVPVAEGGENDILNLITSCRDCNRGKGKQPLTTSEILKKQKAELDALNERREQMEMVIQWRTELQTIELEEVEAINDYIAMVTGYELNENGKRDILDYLKRFSFQEVYDATETSVAKYYKDDERSFNNMLNKIGGICYNRRKNNGLL